MPLMQIFATFSNFYKNLAANKKESSSTLPEKYSAGMKRSLPQEEPDSSTWVAEEIQDFDCDASLPKKRRHYVETGRSTLKGANIGKISAFSKASTFALNNFKESSEMDSSVQDEVVYIRKSLLTPQQLEIAAATEKAIKAQATLSDLRAKAIQRELAIGEKRSY